MARLLVVWGCGAGSGKSILTFGLSRELVNRGLAVRVVKPVTVSSGAVGFPRDPRRFDILAVNYATATRSPIDPASVPIALEPRPAWVKSDVFNADYDVRGWLCGNYVGEGGLRHVRRWMPVCTQAVRESLTTAAASCDVLIVEGSGSPADAAHVALLANLYPVRGVDRAAILVVDCLQGNPFAQIAGTIEMLGSNTSKLLGYVLNRTIGAPPRPEAFDRVARATGINELGRIVPRDPGPPPEVLRFDEEVVGDVEHLRTAGWFDEVATVVTARLDVSSILSDLPEVNGWDD